MNEFHAAQAAKMPAPTIRFTEGSDAGEAELHVDAGESEQDALDRWAATLLGVEPGVMRLLDVTEVRAWGDNPNTGMPYRYVKAKVVRVGREQAEAEQAAQRWLRSRRPRPSHVKRASGRPCAVWWPITDVQMCKGGRERFGPPQRTTERLDWSAYEAFPQWTAALKRDGYAPDTIFIFLGGDLTEGISGSYANQPFTVTGNLATQFELAFEHVDRHVSVASKLAPRVVVTGVSSNHDQQARDGGRDNVTDDWDDRTFTILRQLARLYAQSHDNVTVRLPDDPNVMVEDDGHLIVAGIHGHKPKVTRTNIPGSLWTWWDRQRANLHPAGAAQVMLAGHHHHRFDVGPQGGRYLIGLPSLDNGSQFLADSEGTWSMPGVRPFATTADGVVNGAAAMLVWPEDRKTVVEQTGQAVA